jgi:uncharacterized protein YgiM (DUF1202 family)
MKKLMIITTLCLLATFSNAQQKYVSANVNLRTSPQISDNKITTIPSGTQVIIASDSAQVSGWTKVNFEGKTGYVSSKYLVDEYTEDEGDNNVSVFDASDDDIMVKIKHRHHRHRHLHKSW